MVVKINHLLTPPPPPQDKKNKMIEFLYCKKIYRWKKNNNSGTSSFE